MDEELKNMLKQIEDLDDPVDRCLNKSLLFVGRTIELILNAGPDQERLILFKNSLDNLFLAASKAITDRSANSN